MVNYFRMRGKAVDIRKDINSSKHAYEDIRKRHAEMAAILKKKGVKASEAKKLVKKEKKGFKVIVKDVKKFTQLIHDVFMAVGLLFSDAMLLLSISVKKVRRDIQYKKYVPTKMLANKSLHWNG